MHSSKITTKGQVTIPQELRELLGVQPGDKIVFEPNDNGDVTIKKIDARVSLAGCLNKRITRKASDAEIEQAIDQGWNNRGSN